MWQSCDMEIASMSSEESVGPRAHLAAVLGGGGTILVSLHPLKLTICVPSTSLLTLFMSTEKSLTFQIIKEATDAVEIISNNNLIIDFFSFCTLVQCFQ